MKAVRAEELDRMFDEGEDISEYMDLSSARKLDVHTPRMRRVALDMGGEAIARLDAFAARYGITRQSLIKVWLVERMDQEDERAARRAEAACAQ